MFFRSKKSGNRTYLQIVESYRDLGRVIAHWGDWIASKRKGGSNRCSNPEHVSPRNCWCCRRIEKAHYRKYAVNGSDRC